MFLFFFGAFLLLTTDGKSSCWTSVVWRFKQYGVKTLQKGKKIILPVISLACLVPVSFRAKARYRTTLRAALNTHWFLPLRSSQSYGSPSSLQLSWHKTRKVPHHSTESCDREITWPTDTSFGSTPYGRKCNDLVRVMVVNNRLVMTWCMTNHNKRKQHNELEANASRWRQARENLCTCRFRKRYC